MRAITYTAGATKQAAKETNKFAKASAAATREARNILLDCVIQSASLKNDAGLARLLVVAPPVISKIRHGRLAVGPTLAIAINEVTDISITDITVILAGQVAA
ncbi:hypothetical protein ACO0LC_14465 [Undibacterium sp. JH2W]|uniref:hypothetical protein n=1 Tax=Undibacterium sp. JH2W TaxID=3413037 RepID=UPI003BF3AD05